MPDQRAQQLLEAAPDAMVVIDGRGTINLVNAACERLFGYRRAELLGKPVEILLPQSAAARHVGLRDGYIASPTSRAMGATGQELRARRHDGSEMPVEISLSPLASPEGLLVVAAVRDVSDRKRAEQEQKLAELALRESEERLAAAARGANLGLWDVDPSSGVILVNEVFETQLGYPPGALRETPDKWSRLRGGLAAWPELLHPDDRDFVVDAISRHVAGETEVYRAEHRVRGPDGSYRWILSVGNSVERDAAGHPLRVNGVHIDITEMKGLQAALEHARDAAEAATRAKSDFLANMSHEIRTPMNAVLGMTHLALQTSLTPQQEDYLVKAHTAAEALLGIINDILDFSKIEAGMLQIERVDFSLDEVLENVANLLAEKVEQKKLELRVDRAGDVPAALRGDPLRLGQILLNLVNNAVKFTETGGIVLSVRLEAPAWDSVTLRFSVRDTGIGLTDEQIGRLFRAFSQADTSTTRRYGGTGLGLSICKSLTALMDGRIWVESRLGAGSEFFFTATFGAGGQAPRTNALDMTRVDDLRGARILLVEDNEINRQVAREILEQAGLVVVPANGGREAVDAVTRGTYDAVLMDIQMPVMDGHDATRRIREWESSTAADATPIIAMTAHAMQEEVQKSLAAGMNAHVAKPIDRRHLFSALRQSIKPRPGLGVSPAPPAHSGADVEALPAVLPGIDIADGLGRVGGNMRAYRDLLGRFTKSFADAGEQAERLLAAGEVDAAGRIVHSLKGVAGNLGATRLHDAAAAAEAAIRRGGDADRSVALHALRVPLQEVIGGLERLIRAPVLSGASAGDVTRDRVARLPPELRDEFRTAVTRADLQTMLALVDRVAALDASLAHGLRALVDDFAYDRLLAVLSGTSAR